MSYQVVRAAEFAAEKHRGQVDKIGIPYIEHVLRVAESVAGGEYPTEVPENRVVAAILHDIIEDTGTTRDDLLQAGFHPTAVNIVECLTRRSGESYEEYILRVAEHRDPTFIKLADLRENLDPARMVKLDTATRARLTAKYMGPVDLLIKRKLREWHPYD